MNRSSSFSLLLTLSMTTAVASGQGLRIDSGTWEARNHPNASLVVNHESLGAAPVSALMGENDPNLIAVSGTPGAAFSVVLEPAAPARFGSGAFERAIPETLLTGTLDAFGQAEIVLPVDTFAAGDAFTLRAAVDDATRPSGVRWSGASSVQVLQTMSAQIALNMQPGSIADVRGPLMAVTANSVTIGNLVFQTTAKTDYANVDGIGDLVVGDWLDVNGEFTTNGFVATEIGLEDAEPLVRLSGRVQGIGPSGIVVLGVSIYVSSETVFADAATGRARSFADVELAMPIEVWVEAETMYPHAEMVDLDIRVELEPEPEPEREPEVEIEVQPAPPFCS